MAKWDLRWGRIAVVIFKAIIDPFSINGGRHCHLIGGIMILILKRATLLMVFAVSLISVTGCTPGGSCHYADVSDINFFYSEYGTKQAEETILLLNGGFAIGETWIMQIPALAAKYRVIVPDSRGHGRTSDSFAPISYALMAEDMVNLLLYLDIDKTHVIGWSDGGVIGLHMAIDHPEVVSKLVLFGTPYHERRQNK
ncbi:MAG: alpha/beta hydrolase [Proteobacteria bacterium]|nr:alpha/beta hydrolase [Pseudomonadota bacterium]